MQYLKKPEIQFSGKTTIAWVIPTVILGGTCFFFDVPIMLVAPTLLIALYFTIAPFIFSERVFMRFITSPTKKWEEWLLYGVLGIMSALITTGMFLLFTNDVRFMPWLEHLPVAIQDFLSGSFGAEKHIIPFMATFSLLYIATWKLTRFLAWLNTERNHYQDQKGDAMKQLGDELGERLRNGNFKVASLNEFDGK